MKNIPVLIVVLVAFLLLGFSNKGKEKYIENLGFVHIPSGTMQYKGESVTVRDFYIFETEISNKQYQEFLFKLKKQKNWEALRVCAIDSANWNTALSFDNSYAAEYHLTAQYAEYPVVNISYEAALLFCNWLQQKIDEKVSGAIVRLPSETEWIYAAKGGNPNAMYPWEGQQVKAKKDTEFCNYNSPDDGTCLATNFARSYHPNGYGLYNMCGNVSEWTNVPGETIGGSWNSDALQMQLESDDPNSGSKNPSVYIGFRPVVIVN